MSTRVEPTVLDVARSVARLNQYGNGDPSQPANVDGRSWTVGEMRRSVARNLAGTIGRTVRLGRVTRRDAGLMLAAAGADSATIDTHARMIASMLRSYHHEYGSWGSWL